MLSSFVTLEALGAYTCVSFTFKKSAWRIDKVICLPVVVFKGEYVRTRDKHVDHVCLREDVQLGHGNRSRQVHNSIGIVRIHLMTIH